MTAPDPEDTLGAATRALGDALGQLTRALGEGAQDISSEVSSQLSSSLRGASRSLADASDSVARSTGAQRRNARAEQTRKEILTAARHLFATRGYEGASVGDIAKEAGFTKGALYANFDSKEALFLEIARSLSVEDAEWLAEHAGDTPEVAAHTLSFDGTSLERTLLGLEVWTYAARHEEARPELSAAWRRTLGVMASAVAPSHGRQAPTDADLDTAFGLTAVHALGQVFTEILGPEEVTPITRRLTARLVHGSGSVPPAPPTSQDSPPAQG